MRAPRSSRPVALLTRAALIVALVGAIGIVAPLVSGSSSDRAVAADPLGAGGEFHPLDPDRVLDTRSGINISAGPQPMVPVTGSTFEVPLSGRGGLPDMTGESAVLGVALSITVVEPTQPGFLAAYGTGGPESTTSIVNFDIGEAVPNMAILAPGDDGAITVRLESQGDPGTAHVFIDVFGWFSTSEFPESGSRLIPVGPGRIFDSRLPEFGAEPIAGGAATPVQIRGATSLDPRIPGIVPGSSTVAGALVNVTAVNQGPDSQPTFVSVLPTAPAPGVAPETSNLNLRADHIMANLVLTPIGPDGSIWIYNASGSTHLIVDVVAYLQPRPTECREGRVVPLAGPFRVLDTRQPQFGSSRLGAGQAETWSFAAFAGDVSIDGRWVGPQSALIGNLTATGLVPRADWEDWMPPVESFLTAFPATPGATLPVASNVNLRVEQSVANATLLQYGSTMVDDELDEYSVRVFNHDGLIHYLVDAAAVVLADGPDAPAACG